MQNNSVWLKEQNKREQVQTIVKHSQWTKTLKACLSRLRQQCDESNG